MKKLWKSIFLALYAPLHHPKCWSLLYAIEYYFGIRNCSVFSSSTECEKMIFENLHDQNNL